MQTGEAAPPGASAYRDEDVRDAAWETQRGEAGRSLCPHRLIDSGADDQSLGQIEPVRPVPVSPTRRSRSSTLPVLTPATNAHGTSVSRV